MTKMIRLVDSHCHLTASEYKENKIEVSDLLKEIEKNVLVTHVISVGTTLEDSKAAAMIANIYDFVYATAGIHPLYAMDEKINEET